jgi:hypothetical protein
MGIDNATQQMRFCTGDTALASDIIMSLLKTKSMFIANCTSVPATPTGGGALYVEAGALKYKGSGGTITTLGAA